VFRGSLKQSAKTFSPWSRAHLDNLTEDTIYDIAPRDQCLGDAEELKNDMKADGEDGR
jgi:hypothetical protein